MVKGLPLTFLCQLPPPAEGLTALLCEAKASVVASNAHPRWPSSRVRVAQGLLLLPPYWGGLGWGRFPSLLGRAGVGPFSLPTGEGWGGAVFPPYGGGLGWGCVLQSERYAVNTGVDETAYSRQDNAGHADSEACACVRVALDGWQRLRALLHVHGLYDKQVVVE